MGVLKRQRERETISVPLTLISFAILVQLLLCSHLFPPFCALHRSVRTHLKRRRKEIDYKILSQRGKNRESNAFVLLEAQLKNSAAKSLMKGGKTPNNDGAVDVVC